MRSIGGGRPRAPAAGCAVLCCSKERARIRERDSKLSNALFAPTGRHSTSLTHWEQQGKASRRARQRLTKDYAVVLPSPSWIQGAPA